MSKLPRRGFLVGAMVIAGAAMPVSRAAWAQTGQRTFAPPTAPSLLRRRVLRQLSDRDTLMVERSWLVRFVPKDTGYSLTGRQESVLVETPEHLEPLAQMERDRIEERFFPLELNNAGMIVSEAAIDTQDAIKGALDHVRSALADEGIAPSDMLDDIAKAASRMTARLPRDLFMPQQMMWEARRTLALPGGDTGIVDIAFEAKMAETDGVLGQATRRVTTMVGDEARIAEEQWFLDPAPTRIGPVQN